jgi:hypothetical protein
MEREGEEYSDMARVAARGRNGPPQSAADRATEARASERIVMDTNHPVVNTVHGKVFGSTAGGLFDRLSVGVYRAYDDKVAVGVGGVSHSAVSPRGLEKQAKKVRGRKAGVWHNWPRGPWIRGAKSSRGIETSDHSARASVRGGRRFRVCVYVCFLFFKERLWGGGVRRNPSSPARAVRQGPPAARSSAPRRPDWGGPPAAAAPPQT